MIIFSYFCLVLGFIVNIALYFQKSRVSTLWYSFVSSGLFGLFFLISISVSGAIVCAVAMANTAYQALQKEEMLKQTRVQRNFFAAVCAIIGTIIYQQNSADLLPMGAFIVNCIAETQASQQPIYVLYCVSLLFWIAYGVAYEDYFYVLIDIILLGVNLWVLLQYFRSQRPNSV